MSTSEGRAQHFTPGENSSYGSMVFHVPGLLTAGTDVSVRFTPYHDLDLARYCITLGTAHGGSPVKARLDITINNVSIFTVSAQKPLLASGVMNLSAAFSSLVRLSAGKTVRLNIISGSTVAADMTLILRTLPG